MHDTDTHGTLVQKSPILYNFILERSRASLNRSSRFITVSFTSEITRLDDSRGCCTRSFSLAWVCGVFVSFVPHYPRVQTTGQQIMFQLLRASPVITVGLVGHYYHKKGIV